MSDVPSPRWYRWLAVIAVVAVLGTGAAGIRSWHAPQPAVAVSALASLSIVDTASASDLLARFDFPEVTATRVAVVEISWHSLGNPWWPLNQTSGTVVPDSSGVGNYGTEPTVPSR